MNEGIFKNQQEVVIPQVALATEQDWEECKRLRVLQVSGEDARMFGADTETLKKEQERTKEDWKQDLSSSDMFFVLSKNGPKAVGFGRAIQEKEGIWRIGWGYTEKEFRKKGFGTKNTMLRLQELLKRGATEAKLYVKSDNEESIKVQQSLGFTITQTWPSEKKDQAADHLMILDLTDKAVIERIKSFVI